MSALKRYPTQLPFVAVRPESSTDVVDKKIIRANATRSRVTRRRISRPKLDHGSQHAHNSFCASHGALATILNPSTLTFRHIGSAFSGLSLPPGIESHMIQDLVRLIHVQKHGVYPHEICFDVHVVERGWFPYMINDICCLHSLMYSVRAFLDDTVNCRSNVLAIYHYERTLQLLQARLDEADHTLAISDATIMVITTLMQTAELIRDWTALDAHVKGLEKIVGLRGGVRGLCTHHNLQVKVCRADLSHALLSGARPCLSPAHLSWRCLIADRDLIRCSHEPYETDVKEFGKVKLDAKLHNVLRDLHDFSCLSNLAYQTSRKFSPELYNEMLISILYRLSLVSFEEDQVQESMRVGLLAYASAIFMQRQYLERRFECLTRSFKDVLAKLRRISGSHMPVMTTFWLLMVSCMISGSTEPTEDWIVAWLDEIIHISGISSWFQAREMLRSVVWIDFIHTGLGEKVVDAAMRRLGTSKTTS